MDKHFVNYLARVGKDSPSAATQRKLLSQRQNEAARAKGVVKSAR